MFGQVVTKRQWLNCSCLIFTCGACEVTVDVLALRDVQEQAEDEVPGRDVVVGGTLEGGEVVGQVGVLDLLLQEVRLVQKENDGGVLEPFGPG